MDEIRDLEKKINKLTTLEYMNSVCNIIHSEFLDNFDNKESNYINENKKFKKDWQNIFIKFLNKVKETFEK